MVNKLLITGKNIIIHERKHLRASKNLSKLAVAINKLS